MTEQKCGFVALVGAPNAGKSTLLNALVGQKLGIVTHKAQTTRRNVRGVWTEGDTQIIFVDTPGLLADSPTRMLETQMTKQYQTALADADAVVFVLDASLNAAKVERHAERFFSVLQNAEKKNSKKTPKIFLCLNKVDLVKPRSNMLPLMELVNGLGDFEEVFAISALKDKGLDKVHEKLKKAIPAGNFHFDEDEVTDVRSRDLAAEITREQALQLLHDEVPYDLAVETVAYKEQEDGSVRIDQNLVIQRNSQKRIVVGEGGSKIKEIGTKSRKQIMDALEQPVHLFLKVKVRPKWADNPQFLAEQGLAR